MQLVFFPFAFPHKPSFSFEIENWFSCYVTSVYSHPGRRSSLFIIFLLVANRHHVVACIEISYV